MIKLYTSLLLFSIFSLGSLAWFLIELYSLFSQISNHQAYISFNKGSMYLLGVGLGSLILTWLMLYGSVFKKTLTERLNRFYTRLVLSSILLLFIFPQLVHYPLESYLQSEEYKECHELSHRWLHAQTIIYSKSSFSCSPTEFENSKN